MENFKTERLYRKFSLETISDRTGIPLSKLKQADAGKKVLAEFEALKIARTLGHEGEMPDYINCLIFRGDFYE